jgi:EAL domain-containing protein (putative c-di-GMP-specific phosphodiesterase class I)
MPEAEDSELIEPLTRWVLNEAIRQQRQWSDAGLDLNMAVNISAHSLRPHSELPETVAELTDRWGGSPDKLTIEVTENTIINRDMAQVLDLFHGMGQRLSIDDFGTGHSSLAYLQKLTVDEIKMRASRTRPP